MKKLILSLALLLIFTIIIPVYTFAGADYTTFTPHYGRISTYESGDARYAYIYAKWNDTGISEFDASNDTYEQEVIFYNYDGNAYATKCTSFQSDLPSAYKDTQALDSGNEMNIAVGTTDADSLEADKYYYTTMTLNKTSSSSSMYKVQSQEGYYILFQSKWTTFAETTNRTIPFKQGFTAPEARYWSYEVDPNDSTSSAKLAYTSEWNGGTISSTSDEDYWKIYLSTGNKTIRLIDPSGKDYDVKVYNSSGTLVTGNYSASDDYSATHNFTSSGYYCITCVIQCLKLCSLARFQQVSMCRHFTGSSSIFSSMT